MLHQNEIWETFPLWEDCFKRWLSLVLLLVFSSENQWLLSISCSHIVFLSDVFFFIFSLFLTSFFSCIFSYLLFVVFIYCSFLFLFKMSGWFFFFLVPHPYHFTIFFSYCSDIMAAHDRSIFCLIALFSLFQSPFPLGSSPLGGSSVLHPDSLLVSLPLLPHHWIWRAHRRGCCCMPPTDGSSRPACRTQRDPPTDHRSRDAATRAHWLGGNDAVRCCCSVRKAAR